MWLKNCGFHWAYSAGLGFSWVASYMWKKIKVFYVYISKVETSHFNKLSEDQNDMWENA